MVVTPQPEEAPECATPQPSSITATYNDDAPIRVFQICNVRTAFLMRAKAGHPPG
jgi:hypothetical protein